MLIAPYKATALKEIMHREEDRQVRKKATSLLSFLVSLFIFATLLNWPWEMLHMSLYKEFAEKSWNETAFPCFLASLGDGV